jgi:hypothetical protein
MTIINLLRQRKDSIRERWLEYALSTYAPDATRFFASERDQFANPVGARMREGTGAILQDVIEGIDAENVCAHLERIIKVRAIQDFSPSQAISFVFLLKDAIRRELRDVDFDRKRFDELAAVDSSIDQIALFAFDIYVKCREQVYELRVDEVKRNVSAIMKRFTQDETAEDETGDAFAGGAVREGGGS